MFPFVHLSSASNKTQPHILVERLASYFDATNQISVVVFLNFLLDRVQQEFVNGHTSNTADACGSPQGCVLSPLFFKTLTSTGLSLVTTVPYQRVLSGGRTITWTSVWLKTKETISDFSKSSSNLEARVVHGAIRVKIGEAYKLPGMCLTPNSVF